MKLRQKLAVVLASAMIVTAVPVVTMAASTNSLTKETLKVKKDSVTTENALKITFKDNQGGKEVFYLELTNSKWDDDAIEEAKADLEAKGVKYEKQNDTLLKVTVNADQFTADKETTIVFPILAEVTGGDAEIKIVTMGGETTVSSSAYKFATTAEKKMSVKVGDAKTFYTNGSIADLTIEEAFKGSLAEGATFKIELDDADFNFASMYPTDEDNAMTLTKDEVEFKYGFYSNSGEATVKVWADKDDAATLYVKVSAIKGDTAGSIVIKNLQVKSTTKKPESGDLLADIKSVNDSLVAEVLDAKVATISEYGVYAKMKDEKAVDIKAGRIEEVEFEIGENVEDSMISGREFEMKLENGHWDYKKLVKDLGTEPAKKTDDDYKEAATKIDAKKLAAELLDNDDDWAKEGVVCTAEFDVDEDGLAIVDTIIFTVGNTSVDNKVAPAQSNDQCDKLKFKTNVCVSIEDKEKENVTLIVNGRALENEATTTVANIINPFDVTYEQANLKVGLQGQTAGTLTLTETDKDMFQKGDITFTIKKDDGTVAGIYLTDVEVETSTGIKGEKSTKNEANKSATVKLTRVTKEASTVTFKDMQWTTDRTVPEGTYDLEISGTGIDADGHTLVIEDFIKITTTNTQDITSNGLAKGSSKFVIGESKYTFENQEVAMDAPSYIQDPGYTMVPVRYVAQAFGVAEKDIMFGAGTVTIFAGERTISLTNGSNIAVVNGNSITMGAAVVIKDGRTYAPASQIANLLGIQSEWDSATKTATFTNK